MLVIHHIDFISFYFSLPRFNPAVTGLHCESADNQESRVQVSSSADLLKCS